MQENQPRDRKLELEVDGTKLIMRIDGKRTKLANFVSLKESAIFGNILNLLKSRTDEAEAKMKA